MNGSGPTIIRLLPLLLLLLLIQGCSGDVESPEAQVRQFIDTAVEAGEARSVSDLLDLTHRDYSDQHGNNRKRLEGLLRVYFFQHKNIHLFTRIESIEVLGDSQASVNMHVAMAGTAISGVDALASLRARIYRFELQLVKIDDWQLRHANWAPASMSAFE